MATIKALLDSLISEVDTSALEPEALASRKADLSALRDHVLKPNPAHLALTHAQVVCGQEAVLQNVYAAMVLQYGELVAPEGDGRNQDPEVAVVASALLQTVRNTLKLFEERTDAELEHFAALNPGTSIVKPWRADIRLQRAEALSKTATVRGVMFLDAR